VLTPERLAALHAAAFVSPRPWSAAEFAELLGLPGVFLIVRGEAFAVGRAAAGEAELLTLAVPAAQRRQGRGRALVAAFEAAARARGAERAWLEVAADNAPARALYRAAGWTEAGRRRRYYARPGGGAADALLMTRALVPPHPAEEESC
jgi:ribosomal-protein-alanine N-acetyltransferase